MKSKFTSINNILPKVIAQYGLDKRMYEQALFSLWPSLVDDVYAHRSAPLYLDSNHTLIITVKDSSTAQELSFLKSDLLKKLQQIAPTLGLTINNLRFDLKQFQTLKKKSAGTLAKVAPEQVTDSSMPMNSATQTGLTEEKLATITLDSKELEEIGGLKEKLTRIFSQLDLPKTDRGRLVSPANRIARLLELRLKLKKWHQKHNLPLCSQCHEPLPLSSSQLNMAICQYCRNLKQSKA